MYDIGEYVIHMNTGICKVSDFTKMDISGREEDYYVLLPIREKGGKIFSPVDNPNGNVRKIITSEEAWKLIDEIPSIEEMWIDNDKLRESKYKEAIKSCNCVELIKIIKTLYIRKNQRIAEGKKNTATDERYFKMAEDYLYSELAFAIGKDKDDMKDLIAQRVN